MARSPEEYAHHEWLGYVQPIGLIVSVPAMLEAQCYINKNIIGEHKRFLNCLPRNKNDDIIPEITDFPAFAQKCLEWEAEDLKEIPQRVPLCDELSSLEVILPQYHETLRPTYAVLNFQPPGNKPPNEKPPTGGGGDEPPKDGEEVRPSAQELNAHTYLMLIQVLPTGTGFDEPSDADSSRHWNAAPQLKFERLLRETGVPIGLLCNGKQLRLVYAPRGESSGHATFNVDEMVQVAGRPMFAALHMLLSADRMFTLGENQRLPAILANSRKYQNTVSNKLAEQVLAALYELMRGFQAANDVRKGELLRKVLASDPNQVYSGLLRVLMRLVFVLYAEDRDLMSGDPVYSNNYSLTGLFERLRSDAGRFPDTMDSRFGAWSHLLTLFRLVYDGGQHDSLKLLARKGYLFDPGAYPFLEGRTSSDSAVHSASVPRISDGVVYRVLRNLLILDGERLSYRTLDVEQIGSVYEKMMGFNLEVAQGQSIAIKPVKSHGAPATINLDELLATKGKDRAKWLKAKTDQSITGQALKDLQDAESIDDLLSALDKKIAKKVTPRIVPQGSIVLQPSDERRRSGSHYTPRSLTKPIVETTLQPILKQLVEPPQKETKGQKTLLDGKGRKTKLQAVKSERDEEAFKLAQEKGAPHPRQILNLKVCDPAMGSGAFLVETCRQLGDELVAAWHAHDCVPTADIPPDEDEILYARRLVAQRCLYGVDKNPMAVDLSKLSLWLATLAKDHPFTFLDHSLRHGDSLVGLTAEQIAGFTWEQKPRKKKRGQGVTFMSNIQSRLEKATAERKKILDAREDAPYRDQEQRMALAEEALSLPRLIGDACISAFFSENKMKAREERRDVLFASLTDWLQSGDMAKRQPLGDAVHSLRTGEHPVPPFHWEIEFPEVFGRENGGFDAFVGNPPFMGGTWISGTLGDGYFAWTKEAWEGSGSRADLVAYFFRRSFELARNAGTVGLIATNTIGQGDTRAAGLRFICNAGGNVYSARKRFRWPGEAAVVVSVVWLKKGHIDFECILDGKVVPRITAYLVHAGGNDDPHQITSNYGLAFKGVDLCGMGFTFDDNDNKGVASSISAMKEIIGKSPRSKELILPYIGGAEINEHPQHFHHRYAINFGDRTEEEARKWPELLQIVEQRVRPERMKTRDTVDGRRLKKHWWQFNRTRPELFHAINGMDRVIACSQVSAHHQFAFLPAPMLYANYVIVFAFDSYQAFAMIQSRVHETWVKCFASSMKDDTRYTPSDCFDTFPFPSFTEEMAAAGMQYEQVRAKHMIDRQEGMTKTYNRFHDPDETSSEIMKLRELHDEMDRAVLRAYGWDDLAEQAKCEFLLDYEEEEDDDPTAKKSKKRKPWRYRWPDEFRDEVLARLLELNEQRAMEEKLAGKAAAAAEEKKVEKPKRRTKKPPRKVSLFQQEADRQRWFVLMLLRAWDGKPLTRRALNAGMILMLDDKLRTALLDNKTTAPRKRGNDVGLNELLTDMSVDDFIEIDNKGFQQIVRVSSTAPSTDDATTGDQKRIAEVKEYFRRESESGNVTESEDFVDAELDLVSP